MMDFLTVSKELFAMISVQNVIDILIVAYLVYKIIYWVSGTQAAEVAKGLLLIVLTMQLSSWFGLITLSYILKNVLTAGLILLVVVFQPELRRILGRIGRTSIFENRIMRNLFSVRKSDANFEEMIDTIVQASTDMGKERRGALIVIERQTDLDDIVSTGIKMEAALSKELLENIFVPYTPLHDGAAVINLEEGKIMAAGCLLPLTQIKTLRKELGTRHRAGLGMSEVSDALTIIVSEETGTVSVAVKGRLSRFLNATTLKKLLVDELAGEEGNVNIEGFLRFRQNEKEKEE